MIFIFEQDVRVRNGRRFNWTPHLFRRRHGWKNKTTWRLGWGMWSVSYYPSKGIREFFEHIEHTKWWFSA